MDRLWSPWRLAYVTGPKQSECIFCVAAEHLGKGSESPPLPADSLIVCNGRLAYVILNLYPYNNGHLMVVPHRHVGSLAALSPEEVMEIGVLAQRSETALNEAYGPQGINVGINLGKAAGAGVLDHLHVHVVPRWTGDTNFMTVVGEARVLPESLDASAQRLRPIFAKLSR
jgi:ATP adenylyltransferase